MRNKLIKFVELSFIGLIALSLSAPASAESASKKQSKTHHVVKHQRAHAKKVAHAKKSSASKKVSAKASAHKATSSQRSNSKAGETYIVKSGDVFGKVAQKYQPAGMPLKKVMQTIYAANKKAFVNGDQKKLVVGSQLNIPLSLLPKSVEVAKAVETKSVEAKAPATANQAGNAAKATAQLEDDPKNVASQIKAPVAPQPAAQQLTQSASTPTPAQPVVPAPVAELPKAAVAAPVQATVAGPVTAETPLVAPGEIPATQQEPVKVRRDTGLNGFILTVLIAIVLGLLIYFKVRAKRVQKEQQDLINELMARRDVQEF